MEDNSEHDISLPHHCRFCKISFEGLQMRDEPGVAAAFSGYWRIWELYGEIELGLFDRCVRPRINFYKRKLPTIHFRPVVSATGDWVRYGVSDLLAQAHAASASSTSTYQAAEDRFLTSGMTGVFSGLHATPPLHKREKHQAGRGFSP